ncbi:MAG: acetolactate decarboxylase [Planctomycetes bacterium]|nr:acetolactate decarboxylase [Planctomycetota bacterium]
MQRPSSELIRLPLLALLALTLLAGCSRGQPAAVYQHATIDALMTGVYDGNLRCDDLLAHGDFGIGTFDALDGEMVVLDGVVHQVRFDGSVHPVAGAVTTPFATVCRFHPDQACALPAGTDFPALEQLVNARQGRPNLFCALRVHGRFATMKTRSVPRQARPYPPLAEVAKGQAVFTMQEVSGTIVGFRCPAFVKGVNVPGYHLHFLSDDRRQGGHILAFTLAEGGAELMTLSALHLDLPAGSGGFQGADLGQDRSADLHRIESDRK